MIRPGIYNLIDAERIRQEEKFPGRNIASNLPLDTKLRILVEEVGEVARAIDGVENFDGGGDLADSYTREDALGHLREELVQVAACAVGILESLEAEKPSNAMCPCLKDHVAREVIREHGMPDKVSYFTWPALDCHCPCHR